MIVTMLVALNADADVRTVLEHTVRLAAVRKLRAGRARDCGHPYFAVSK
jgi:hypothetical protein